MLSYERPTGDAAPNREGNAPSNSNLPKTGTPLPSVTKREVTNELAKESWAEAVCDRHLSGIGGWECSGCRQIISETERTLWHHPRLTLRPHLTYTTRGHFYTSVFIQTSLLTTINKSKFSRNILVDSDNERFLEVTAKQSTLPTYTLFHPTMNIPKANAQQEKGHVSADSHATALDACTLCLSNDTEILPGELLCKRDIARAPHVQA